MGANLPLVSVVTPAYNQASFLRATIESVLAQDYAHIEYRVINDGSTDRTPEILEEYKNRVQVESQPNRGQTATINKGWEQSRGDIFIWLNSDDTFLPGAVTKAVNYLEQHPHAGLWALNPFQFAGVAVVLACIDFATFWGWVQALRRPRSGGSFPPAGERDLMAGGKG